MNLDEFCLFLHHFRFENSHGTQKGLEDHCIFQTGNVHVPGVPLTFQGLLGCPARV